MANKYNFSRFCSVVFAGGIKNNNINTFAQKRIKQVMTKIRLLQKKDCEKEI